MSSILVPLFAGIFSNFGFFFFVCFFNIFVIQMTKNILILEGGHMSIKKNIYFYKRDIKKSKYS